MHMHIRHLQRRCTCYHQPDLQTSFILCWTSTYYRYCRYCRYCRCDPNAARASKEGSGRQQVHIEVGCFALQECCGLQQPWEGCLVGQIIRKMKKHHLRHRRAQRKKSRGEWWTVCGFKSTAVDTLCLPFLPFSDVWNACNVWSDLQYTKCFAILRIFMSPLFDRIWRNPQELWHCLLLRKATPVITVTLP